MLSQDVAVEAACMDAQLLGHDEAETGRVQVGAAADHAVLGKAAELPRHVSHDVNCVRGFKGTASHKAFAKTNICPLFPKILAPFIKNTFKKNGKMNIYSKNVLYIRVRCAFPHYTHAWCW